MKHFLIALCVAAFCNNANAQNITITVNKPTSTAIPAVTDSVKKGKYTLVFVNRDSAFAVNGAIAKQRMIDAFFKVYPEEAKIFNPKTSRKVVFIIDPGYDGVAATWADSVHFNPSWMLRIPLDVDVVTHEVMHIVQEYGYSAGPVWLTEGIADYARYKFGVDNAGANWTMPNYKPGQSYTNAYRVTARFLVWIEEKKTPNFVQKVDGLLRTHAYNKDTWKQLTGKTVDELWQEYSADPTI